MLEPVYVLVGFLVVWNAASLLHKVPLGRWLSRHTFFVFCSHGLFNVWLSQVWAALVPVTGVSLVVGFLSVPTVSILCAGIIGQVLYVLLPNLYGLATGGRGLRH